MIKQILKNTFASGNVKSVFRNYLSISGRGCKLQFCAHADDEKLVAV